MFIPADLIYFLSNNQFIYEFHFPLQELNYPPPHKINEWDETVDLTGPIDHLPVSKIIWFWYIFIWVISLTFDKMVPVPGKSNGKDKEFEYNLLKISRYFNLV